MQAIVNNTLTPVAAAAGAAQPPRSKAAVRQPTPPALADVALIDAKQCAAAACIGLSRWFELVAAGKAPQPVIRGPRMSRWRLADVRAWLAGLGG